MNCGGGGSCGTCIVEVCHRELSIISFSNENIDELLLHDH